MRVAYYAWTDLQLFNCCNLRLNQYQDAEAELFLLKLPRISPGLLTAVREAGCFSRIHEIAPVDAPQAQSRLAALLKLNVLFGQRAVKRAYRAAFADAVRETAFDRAVIAGFWAETSFLLRALRRNAPALHIDFIEEGMRHGEELFAYSLEPRLAVRALRYLYDGRYVKQWRPRVERAYFYAPERFAQEPSSRYVYQPLLPVTKENPKAYALLLEAVRDVDLAAYEDRTVILLEDVYAIPFEQVIETAARAVGSERLIVKMHPANRNMYSVQEGVCYDMRLYPFEGMLLKLSLEGKIIVLRYSAVAKNVTYMLQKPCGILQTNGVDLADRLMRTSVK